MLIAGLMIVAASQASDNRTVSVYAGTKVSCAVVEQAFDPSNPDATYYQTVLYAWMAGFLSGSNLVTNWITNQNLYTGSPHGPMQIVRKHCSQHPLDSMWEAMEPTTKALLEKFSEGNRSTAKNPEK